MTALGQSRKFLIASFLLATTLCNLTLAFQVVPSLRNGYQDFTIYYTGARLIRSGRSSALYDSATQYQTQLTFTNVPIRQGPLPFNHPPFEALLFVPFVLLNYWPAYLVWTSLNLIMLAVSMALLRRHFRRLAAVSPILLCLGATAFFPVVIGIIQGQDVILLLLVMVLSVISLDQGDDVLAGGLLGAGLFRPHIIIPLVALLAVRRWRILVGFAPVAFLLGGISVAIVGWRGLLEYVRFVLRIEKTGARGFGSEVVPNLRGLVLGLAGPYVSGSWTGVLIVIWSLVVFSIALHRIRRGRDSIVYSFGLAVITAILVSFHALVYDLTLLLPLSIFLLCRLVSADWKILTAHTILLPFLLFLSPLYIFLLFASDSFFWFSLVLLYVYLMLVLTPVAVEGPTWE